MYTKIMVPVDLAHADRLGKALKTAADLSKHYGAPTCYVGVTSGVPTAVAHNPQEYAAKLDAFAKAEADSHGHAVEAKAITSHDPTSDLDPTLLKAVDDLGADLVVMASHIPNVSDHWWPSNGGRIASQSSATVMIVRG